MLFQLVLTQFAGSFIQFFYILIISFFYFAWCWRRSGQTLAMKTWRLRLIAVNGSRVGWRAVSIRFMIIFVSVIPLFIALWAYEAKISALGWIIGFACVWLTAPYIWSLFDDQHQFLHDRLAKTMLVKIA